MSRWRPGRRMLLRLVLLVGVPVLSAVAALVIWQAGGRYVTTENAYVKADIVQIAPEVSGRVIEVAVRDHARVEAGDVLLRIDPEPFRLAAAKAEAELDAARTLVETARATYPRDRRASLGSWKAGPPSSPRQARRQHDLAARGVAPATRMEETENDAQVARERINVVRQRLARLLTTLKGDPDLPVDEHPTVHERIAERDRAALDLARTTISRAGRRHCGEHAPATRRAGARRDAGLRPGVRTAALGGGQPEGNHPHQCRRSGQRVEVVLDIYPDVTWQGEVESISPATGAEFAILPPQNASGNWVKVVQRLPVRIRLQPHAGEPALRAGITATVSIDTGRQRSLGEAYTNLVNRLRGTANAADESPAAVAKR